MFKWHWCHWCHNFLTFCQILASLQSLIAISWEMQIGEMQIGIFMAHTAAAWLLNNKRVMNKVIFRIFAVKLQSSRPNIHKCLKRQNGDNSVTFYNGRTKEVLKYIQCQWQLCHVVRGLIFVQIWKQDKCWIWRPYWIFPILLLEWDGVNWPSDS